MQNLINVSMSDAEMERRLNAIRASMNEHNIDVLLVPAANTEIHGYIRYMTDMPAFGYPTTLIVPRDDLMTLVVHGPNMGEMPADPRDIRHRGVGKVLTCSSFASVHYTLPYEAQQVVKALAPYLGGRIGMVGRQALSASTFQAVRDALQGDGSLVDASDLVDRIKASRSPEELTAARATANIQDASISEILQMIKPGLRERDVVAQAAWFSQKMGCEGGIYLASSGPMGTPAPLRPPHYLNRVLEEGDAFHILVETSGPGGLFVEIGRTILLGEPTSEITSEFAFVLKAREFTLSMLKPGADPREIWASYNSFMRESGRPEESRIHCHGQGYDLVERPLVRFDEDMPLTANMILACHPTYVHQSNFNWICDSYLLTDSGTERLHQFQEDLLVIGN